MPCMQRRGFHVSEDFWEGQIRCISPGESLREHRLYQHILVVEQQHLRDDVGCVDNCVLKSWWGPWTVGDEELIGADVLEGKMPTLPHSWVPGICPALSVTATDCSFRCLKCG